MNTDSRKPTTIDEYIAGFPTDIQALLQDLRRTIAEAAPGARETISYGMPAFRTSGVLVYFAAAKNHVGFYPTASGVVEFLRLSGGFAASKGAVQFPFGTPIPHGLVAQVVKFRLAEVEAKSGGKRAK